MNVQEQSAAVRQQDKIDQARNERPQFRYSIDCYGRRPQGLTLSSGKLYVFYRGLNMIDILDRQGERLDFFDPYPRGTVNIASMAADNAGNIYLADAENKTILMFGQDNTFLNLFPPRRTDPLAENSLQFPVNVTINRGSVYITDMISSSVKTFSLNGDYLLQFKLAIKGPAGKTAEKPWHPMGVAQTRDGRTLVSDIRGKRVAVFTCNGKFVYFLAEPDGPDKLTAPVALAIDGIGRIHVLDSLKNKIFVYDNYGRFLFLYGEDETGRNILKNPQGMAIDKEKQLIFIADTSNRRVSVWSYGPPPSDSTIN